MWTPPRYDSLGESCPGSIKVTFVSIYDIENCGIKLDDRMQLCKQGPEQSCNIFKAGEMEDLAKETEKTGQG